MSFTSANLLRSILLKEEQGKQSPQASDLAEALGISRAAMSTMIRRMEKSNLIIYKNKKILLSPHGRKKGMMLIRKERLLNCYLKETLKLKTSELVKESNQLKHSCSNSLIDKLDSFLDHPLIDPMGQPIPDARLNLPDIKNMSSADKAIEGKKHKIFVLKTADKNIKAFFSKNKIQAGKNIKVIRKQKNGDVLISVGKKELLLKAEISQLIILNR